MAVVGRAGLAQSPLELLLGFPMWITGPKHWAVLCCSPRRINRKLDWKRSNWDFSIHVGYLSIGPLSRLLQFTVDYRGKF